MIDRQTLTAQLRALGLTGDRPVMVHAGLRSVGPIDGGADTLIDALLDAIAPGGTMLMMVAEDGDAPFDPLTTPADPENGVLAEIFRRRAGDGVSDHPASRFAAIGPDAAALLSPVPLHDYYGPGSPLERFVAMRGLVLRLGAPPNCWTDPSSWPSLPNGWSGSCVELASAALAGHLHRMIFHHPSPTP